MKIKIPYNIYVCSFLLSLVHSIFGIIFYLCCLNLVKKEKIQGAIKFLILVTIRGILSNTLVANISMYSSLKLVLMLLVSTYIIFTGLRDGVDKNIKAIMIGCSVFSLYALISSFLTGTYPVTSSFKIISFFTSICSVFIGVYKTRNNINWLRYLYKIITPLMIVSFIISPLPISRIHNGFFFGVYNHVNMMGIIGAIYLTIILSNKNYFFNKFYYYIIILITLYMQYLSSSRTGMFSSVIILVFYLLTHLTLSKILVSIYLTFSFCFMISLTTNLETDVNNLIQEFVYKGNQDDILSSRRGLQEKAYIKYENNPFLGSGFMTPFEDGKVDYSLNMSLIVEPGNLLWALLGDVGIIGIVLFGIIFLIILYVGNIMNLYLFITAIVICMGEMVFFSVNNIAVLNYILLSVFVSNSLKYKEKKDVG